MAISFIASDTEDFAGALAITFTIPVAAQADDLMIAFVKQSENTGQQTWDDDGGGGNGWTQLTYNRTTGGRDMETAIYWKIHSGSESNPTFTWATGITTEPMSGSILVYRGIDTTNPIPVFGYANAQNDANPPNPSVNIPVLGSTILTIHAATHDDITTPAAPTGYTLRTQVWNGTADDHRNHFTSDLIGLASVGNYTPPDWQHTVANTTPEYHTYTLVIQEEQPLGVTDFNTTESFNWGEQNLVITGFGFEALQGTGKVEFWDDVSGTTKSVQTIDSWGDTSIQIDTVQGSLDDDTIVYLVVTNDSAEESSPIAISVGRPPYDDAISTLSPDHYWTFNNTYNDEFGGRPASVNTGSPGFTTNPLTRGRTHSFTISAQGQRIEIADSPNMNTANLAARSMGGWVRITSVQDSFVCFYEEGGGVNNLAFFMGVGGILIAQLADTGDDNVHAYSDFKLQPNRTYHILFRYDYNGDGLFELFVDGVKQSVTFGNPLTSTGNHLDSHSGDVGWGDAEGTLEVFGTDITFPAAVTCYYQDWYTWTSGLADADIRNELFEEGLVGDDTISTDTEANMQTDIDTYADSVRADTACSFIVEGSSDGDFALDFDNIVFDDGTTIQVQYLGTDTLTITNLNGSNVESSKISTPLGGSVVIVNPITLTVSGLQANSEVRVFDAGTTTEIAGIESTSGDWNTSIQVTSVDISILNLDYQIVRFKNVDTSSDAFVPVVQQVDRQYENL